MCVGSLRWDESLLFVIEQKFERGRVGTENLGIPIPVVILFIFN